MSLHVDTGEVLFVVSENPTAVLKTHMHPCEKRKYQQVAGKTTNNANFIPASSSI
jgi:hypothetical protein